MLDVVGSTPTARSKILSRYENDDGRVAHERSPAEVILGPFPLP